MRMRSEELRCSWRRKLADGTLPKSLKEVSRHKPNPWRLSPDVHQSVNNEALEHFSQIHRSINYEIDFDNFGVLCSFSDIVRRLKKLKVFLLD